MKYIKTFENNIEVKNRILILDVTPSCLYYMVDLLKTTNLYLTPRFDVLLSGQGVLFFENINIKELIDKLENSNEYGVGSVQNAINYVIRYNLIGRILLCTDGFDVINIRDLSNDISILSTDTNIDFKANKECHIFYGDLESLDIFYLPRDNTYEEYERKKQSEKYNL